jgi:hypothetical protein
VAKVGGVVSSVTPGPDPMSWVCCCEQRPRSRVGIRQLRDGQRSIDHSTC